MKQALLPEQDAYGQNIYDSFVYQRGGYDIVEREDEHFTLNGDSNAYTVPFEEWDGIQQDIAPLVKGKVLDVGCGGGKHAIYFQNIGLQVTGIDSSPLAIEVCKLRGLQRAIATDLENLPEYADCYDTILLLGNNFGLFENPQKAKYLLKAWAEMTPTTAQIFAETLDPYGKAFDNEDDRGYQAWNKARGRMIGQVQVRIRYRKYVTPWSDYLFVSKSEMNEILVDTGWQMAETYDDFAIDQYIARLVKE